MAYYLSFITRGNTNRLVGNENYFQLSLIFQVCLQCSCGLILHWIWAIRWKTWRIQQIDPNCGHISTLISGPVTRRHTWPGTWHCGDGWYAADMLWRDGRVQRRRLPGSTSGPIKTFADHGANWAQLQCVAHGYRWPGQWTCRDILTKFIQNYCWFTDQSSQRKLRYFVLRPNWNKAQARINIRIIRLFKLHPTLGS